jgi:lysophospholipase L1-like esterase
MRTRHWILASAVVLICGLTDVEVTCQARTQFSQKPAAPYEGAYSLFIKEPEYSSETYKLDNFTANAPIRGVEFWGYWLDYAGQPAGTPEMGHGFNFVFFAADDAGSLTQTGSRNLFSGSEDNWAWADTGKKSPQGAPVYKYTVKSWDEGPVHFAGEGWLNINAFDFWGEKTFYWVKSSDGASRHLQVANIFDNPTTEIKGLADLAFSLLAGEDDSDAKRPAAEPEELEELPDDPYFAPFKPIKAPVAEGLVLKKGDRLAICGDSITEQKMYSQIIETYLTVCVPELEVTVRQFGWGGEVAPFFHHRMASDVLRFNPTIATTCYGINDHRYQSYKPEFGRTYKENSQAIVRKFKEHGVRVVQGSPGTVGKMPSWAGQAGGTFNDLNLSLLELRNIDVRLARAEQVAFADVFLAMLVAGFNARQKYGDDYMISGKDGVHPDWAGQLVMAYAFLKAMGLDGDIGTITVDLSSGRAEAAAGHSVLSADHNEVRLESEKYPFCATGEPDKDSSIRSGMALVSFNEQLNRFMLVARNGSARRYRVTWGDTHKSYTAAELANGINLADDFHVNPFSEAFDRVDQAVLKKQTYETKQIKSLFHGEEGKVDMDMTVALTEKARAPLAEAIKEAFKPVRHTIRIEAETAGR